MESGGARCRNHCRNPVDNALPIAEGINLHNDLPACDIVRRKQSSPRRISDLEIVSARREAVSIGILRAAAQIRRIWVAYRVGVDDPRCTGPLAGKNCPAVLRHRGQAKDCKNAHECCTGISTSEWTGTT